jgi:hypothetical protein
MGSTRLVWGVVAVAALVALAWWILRSDGDIAAAAAPPPQASPAPSAAPPAEAAAPEAPPDEQTGPEDLGGTWENVDLEAIRREMPDNLYFELALPTEDPQILEARDAERAHWNDEYGKLLSGTASEEEIVAYYDYRHRVSSDYVQFTSYVLDHHRAELPPRDVALLELAQNMHKHRLLEIPRKLQVARERKRQQDDAVEQWRRDEAEFAAP